METATMEREPGYPFFGPIPPVDVVRSQALVRLESEVRAFVSLERMAAGREELYHRVLGNVYQICAAVVSCEEAALTRDEIVDVLRPVREIHARSPFVRRLQEWPRGYPGDFETVEYICSGVNRATAGTIEHSCEAYALSRSIAQQHRNKVQHQAARLRKTMIADPGRSRILSLACGSCPDLRLLEHELPAIAGEIWLNDADPAALELASRHVASVRERCHFRPENALRLARRMAAGNVRFDLVMAGGLFDYLPERHATFLIEHSYALLAPGGTFFFTNIAAGNPYRVLIEYFGDWFLLERSEDDILRFCDTAGVPRENVSIRREESGLAMIVEVEKLE
jgi:SAM-dependent methyltransferase